MSRSTWRVAGFTLMLVLVPGLVVGVRAVSTSSKELDAGHASEVEGRPVHAIEHYRRAMRWTFPFNPYPERAARALRELAHKLEREKDTEGALLAWRSIAGSAAATTSFWSLDTGARNDAVEAIVRLSVPADADTRSTSHAVAIEAFERSGSALWGALLVLGFVGWLAGLCLTASRGFDARGRIHLADARGPLAAAIVGLVLFVTGMLFA